MSELSDDVLDPLCDIVAGNIPFDLKQDGPLLWRLIDDWRRAQAALAHLWHLNEYHQLLDDLYEWQHDQLGYRSARTCQVCGTTSAKHARLDGRHQPACHLRAVEEALGSQQYGLTADPPADVLGGDDE